MSNETSATRSEADAETPAGRSLLARVGAVDARLAAGTLALVTAGALTLFRILQNAPVSLPGAVFDAADAIGVAALLGPPLAAVALGVTTADDRERIGLLFVGVFGLLAAVDGDAAIPAAVATLVGGGVAAGTHFDWPRDYLELRPAIVAALVLSGIAVSLSAALGIAPGLRAPGTALALVALAATPALVRTDRIAWVCGGLAAGTVLAAAATAPFVTGAVSLVAVAAVGTPAVFLALGVGGAVAAVLGAIREGRTAAAVGIACLLVGGVPATVPRAVVVALGLAIAAAAAETGRAAGDPGGDPA